MGTEVSIGENLKNRQRRGENPPAISAGINFKQQAELYTPSLRIHQFHICQLQWQADTLEFSELADCQEYISRVISSDEEIGWSWNWGIEQVRVY